MSESHCLRVIDGIVRVPIPLPLTLKCGRCTRNPVSQWSTEERFASAKKHFRNKHALVTWTLFCSGCGLEFNDSLHAAGRHWKNHCQYLSSRVDDGSYLSSDSLPSDDGIGGINPSLSICDSFFEGNKLIVSYPGRPSRCPLNVCPERFVTMDTLKGTMGSLFRHMETSHLIRGLGKMWRCSICLIEMKDGRKMRHHYDRHAIELALPSVLSPITGNVAATQAPSSVTQGPSSRFFQLWAPSFLNCRSMSDLNEILSRCTRDWLSKASSPDEDEVVDKADENVIAAHHRVTHSNLDQGAGRRQQS